MKSEDNSALLFAIQKSHKSDASLLFMFDDPQPLKPAIDKALGSLRF